MTSEYIFFDEALSQRFVGFLQSNALASTVRPDAMGGLVVSLDDEQAQDLTDETEDRLEAEYWSLMHEQRQALETSTTEDDRGLMGVIATLPDGQSRTVRLPAVYARRLVEHFTVTEIHDLVSAIARDVVIPVTGPLCQR
jgi:hypothetical protein